ncbi:winged helix DNA-binding protein [Halorubrum sp. Atlit-28R]|jgi:DNA-binding IclR family transcriptional regulator|uniref:winged helix DNA-binding protein n=1 Tax=Halorubrum sp. Atlit-28R TaxID=2282129 RepID=UPI001314EC98|nr:winged helix DNA-binding protein [Halorubrum sp. Atlit-28R]
MVEDAPADAPASALPPAVVDLLRLVATPPDREVVAALRTEAPATAATVARETDLPTVVVEECLARLIDEDLLSRSGTPARYRFTEAGAAMWPVLDALDALHESCEAD